MYVLGLNMFNPNLEKLFINKHVTLLVTYDLDCHQNLYDNLYCELSDEDIDFFEVPLNPQTKEQDQAPCDLVMEIENALQDEFGGAITPAHLLIDLEKVTHYYGQLSHIEEFCAQLLKINDIAQKQNLGITLLINMNEPWSAATTVADYIDHNVPTSKNDFIIFAMTDKNPNLLTYANGKDKPQKLDLDNFAN